MAFQSAPDTAEIIVHWVLAGQNLINTFYGNKVGGYDQSDIDTLAATVDQWVADSLLPTLSSSLTYVGTTVRGLTSSIDLEAENNDNAGGGAGGTTTAPSSKALAIKRRSAFTGRGARGRIFLAGIPDASMATPNTVDTGFQIAMEAALNALKDAMDGVDWIEVIVHRVEAGTPLTTAVLFTVVEYVIVNGVIDSMRRRLPGRGD